jgi:hypothetical protein
MHWVPASTRTSHDSHSAQGHYKGDILYVTYLPVWNLIFIPLSSISLHHLFGPYLCEVLTEAELLSTLGWQPSRVQDHTCCDTCHSAKVSEHTAESTSKQPGIFERTCHSLLCQCLMWIEVSGHTFEHLVTDGNKLQHYFRILQWFCFISNVRQTHFDDRWPCKDACLTNRCLTENLGFGPSWLLMKIGNEVLPHNAQLALVPKG